ncbi:NAD-dependent epimerase/dehydratase family protein [Actinoplanes utahensis]|uniref:NAD-dependent dehydratase n=1 Tax=Actinoplanes utahensis TaxID=1869 RepID=A0A0A6U9K9_ACTUT|nr:SDR family oxidoreductase [Actinoplanes utahensis]KHD72086.1 NAD-dependent dehydratase [Actinoplanes utahensis]GIF28831.1 NAD-dependent dehydratase [Actinoplanes utahensis]
MRVLVTGHEGYLGGVVTPRLLAAGHTVVGLDTGLFADRVLGPAPPPVDTLRGDVRDVTPEQCAGVDAVVHLAALCNDPLGDLDPALTDEVNHRATLRLAAAAKSAGVTRFVFASSCSLYGAGAAGVKLTETAAFEPVTPYGESKVLSERGLWALADDDFSPTCLRNATAYGFSPRLRGDLVVNDLTAHAVIAGEVPLRSDGIVWRPLVHVEDIAAAFLAVLEAPREVVHAKAYNVGRSEENYLIRDVAELVAEVLPGSRLSIAAGAGHDRRDYQVSCDLIQAEVPAFVPQWTLRAGISQLAESFRRFGLTSDDLATGRFQRLARIHELRRAGLIDEAMRWSRRP